MNNDVGALRRWWHNSAFLRVLFIGAVIMLLIIPISMIDDQISERQWTKRDAINDVAQKWGHQQTLIGARLVIPYYEITSWKNKDGKTERSRKKRYATFLPEKFDVSIQVDNQTRHRGIFEIPLYQSHIEINGKFNKPNLNHWNIESQNILWNQAELVIGITGASSIQQNFQLNWNNKTYDMEAGSGEANINQPGFHARLNEAFKEAAYNFSMQIDINGSESLYVAPVGKNSRIYMDSNWPDPSFQGYKLPVEHSITNQGFTANWKIPGLSLGYPQQWLNHHFDQTNLERSIVGVNFISPIDNYRMTERSIKYAMLFLVLTFTVLWIFELTSKVRVHLLQYLFIGLGMSIFYLLLLAISEHIHFIYAYATASAAITIMTTAYAKAVFKSNKKALTMGVIVSLIYTYLFALLNEQDYALLTGALGVFVTLAIVMYATRNIDWFNLDNNNRPL